jgi:hypothetical protein
LEVGVDREHEAALLDGIALAHGERLYAADLVGSNKDELRLDPALVRGRMRAVAARKRERARQRRRERLS